MKENETWIESLTNEEMREVISPSGYIIGKDMVSHIAEGKRRA